MLYPWELWRAAPNFAFRELTGCPLEGSERKVYFVLGRGPLSSNFLLLRLADPARSKLPASFGALLPRPRASRRHQIPATRFFLPACSAATRTCPASAGSNVSRLPSSGSTVSPDPPFPQKARTVRTFVRDASGKIRGGGRGATLRIWPHFPKILWRNGKILGLPNVIFRERPIC